MTNKINWNDENTATLTELAGTGTVTQDQLADIAASMGTSARSIGAKLRKMDYDVEKSTGKAPAWSAEQEDALGTFVNANANKYTYVEIAELFQDGAFNAKQIQGKLLNMELFGSVLKAEKKVAPRKYTPEEEVELINLISAGTTIEDIAAAFDKPITSIRGKALSLLRAKQIDAMPKQANSQAKEPVDLLVEVNVAESTVDQIAEAIGKTSRGVKSMLSRRGLTCVDYDGAGRREKLDSKEDVAA